MFSKKLSAAEASESIYMRERVNFNVTTETSMKNAGQGTNEHSLCDLAMQLFVKIKGKNGLKIILIKIVNLD